MLEKVTWRFAIFRMKSSCTLITDYNLFIAKLYHISHFSSLTYLEAGASIFCISKLAFTAISCARLMFFTPFAASMRSSKEINFGGEAVIRQKWYKQGICWKLGMLPKSLLSIKDRTCNQTLLVHQDMTTKTTFYEKKN